jgi:DNA invertase Pin-like site-specific DNA recombinase
MVVTRKAFSYVRFSAKIQAKGESLERQLELTRDYCKRHKLILDETLTLHDLGVSAFRGKNVREGPLAGFLEECRMGKVPRGSVLIVESLDRLSRDQVQQALQLLLSILSLGVSVVTLVPEREIQPDSEDTFALLEPLVIFARSHEESVMKSHRRKFGWKKLRDKARQGSGPMCRKCPAWLELADGKFRVLPGRAEVVRRIYSLATDGYGLHRIAQRLTKDGVPAFGKGGKWIRAYIAKILKSQAAIGVYQPCRMDGRKAVPDGPAIPGYYPAVITEQEWSDAQAAIRGRAADYDDAGKFAKGRRGSPSAGRRGRGDEETCLFTGLLHNARNGERLHVSPCVGKRRQDGSRKLYHYLASTRDTGLPEGGPRIEYSVFEAAVLSRLQELKPADIMADDGHINGREAEIARLSGRLLDIDNRLERAQARARTAEDFDAFLGLIESLHSERKTVGGKLAKLRERKASKPATDLGEVQGLLGMLANAPAEQQAELRGKLKRRVRQIVSGIWVLVLRCGSDRLCAVQLWFASEERHRDYLILHRPGCRYGKSRREGQWFVRSFVSADTRGELDLRKPDHARRLEKALAKFDLETLST